MHGLKELREKLSLSQEQLAAHLGIHRVQLALAERGHRPLPDSAEAKLTRLQIEVYTPTTDENVQDDIVPFFIDKKTEKIVDKTLDAIEWHNANLEKLRSRLEQMRKVAEQSSESKRVIRRMKDKKIEGKEGESRELILDNQKATVQKKSEQSNSVAQALLEAKIELLEAKVKIAEGLLKKLNI